MQTGKREKFVAPDYEIGSFLKEGSIRKNKFSRGGGLAQAPSPKIHGSLPGIVKLQPIRLSSVVGDRSTIIGHEFTQLHERNRNGAWSGAWSPMGLRAETPV